MDRNVDVEAQRQILGSPYTVIGTTDGGARPYTMDRYEYSTNLLGYWVRDKQIMSLEEAVYRLTGKTALMHDLQDRGFLPPARPLTSSSSTLQPLHRSRVSPCMTCQRRWRVKREAIGIDYVMVNGTVLLDNGELTDALPGQIVRGPLYQSNHT